MKKSDKNPINLRNTLIVVLLVLTALISFGFYYTQIELEKVALNISESVSASDQNLKNSTSSNKLNTELAAKQQAVTAADRFYYSTDTYQTEAVVTLKKYANDFGINITDYVFDSSIQNAPSVTITVDSPVTYSNLLQFIGSIENGLPKLQISDLNLSRVENEPGKVNTEKIKIGISVR